MTPVEFRGDLWRQKTRVPGLSCGVVYVILCLAVLIELRLVTDWHRHRHRRTDGHRAIATTARCYASPVKTKAAVVMVCCKMCRDYSLLDFSNSEMHRNHIFRRPHWASRGVVGRDAAGRRPPLFDTGGTRPHSPTFLDRNSCKS